MSQHRPTYNSVSSRRTCECCVKAIKWIPVLFVFSIICWSYYAFVVQLCFLTVPSITQKIILLLLYHVVCFLFLWSYYQTIFTDIAEVPAKFRLPADELEKLYTASTDDEQRRILEMSSHNLPITNRTVNGAVRFCEKCHLLKPDRCHHCSVCGTCVLKMDHHCPWINSCVCFNNYKFFILFLGYALLYCIFVALTSLPYFVQFWKGQLEGMGRFHILFLFFVSVMFAISLVSLFGYHIYLVIVNRTTLEAFRPPIFRLGGPDKNGYSLGYYNNFQEVFGDDKRYWFLPVFTSLGDGVQYPVQTQHEVNFYYEPTNRIDTCSNMPTRDDITTFRLASAQNNHHNDFSTQHVINDELTKNSLQNNGCHINGTVVINLDDSSVVQNPKSAEIQTPQSIPDCRIDGEQKEQIRSINHYDEVPSNTHLLNNDSIIHL